MPDKSQPTLFRFYRSNLATIVWDPEKGKPLAEFVNGQFYTKDPVVAQKLVDMKYPRISLDATEPPDILFKKGRIITGNIQMLPRGTTEESILEQERKAAEQAALAAEAEAIVKGEAAAASTGEDDDPGALSPAEATLKAKGAGQDGAKAETKVKKAAAKKKAAKRKAPASKKSGTASKRTIKRRT